MLLVRRPELHLDPRARACLELSALSTAGIMKAWDVRHWATRGIEEIECVKPGVPEFHGTYLCREGERFGPLMRIGRDVFLTREDAFAFVTQKAAQKIASLEKQIAKLRKDWS